LTRLPDSQLFEERKAKREIHATTLSSEGRTMVFIEWAFNRLAEGAAISLVLFAAGSLAVVCCRQPVQRLRIILLTLTAAFFAPLINLLPGLPHWTLPAAWRVNADIPSNARDVPVRALAATDDSVPASDFEQSPASVASDSDAESPELAATETGAVGDESPDRSQQSLPQEIEQSAAVLNENASRPLPAAELLAAPRARSVNFRRWAVAVYLTGAAALFAWWLFGMACLWRLVRTATAAPEACRAVLREIAGDVADDVEVLVSARTTQPCTFAWRYPVIVLPLDLATATDEAPLEFSREAQASAVAAPLRFCLAHEFAHVARGDVWLWSFTGVVRLVFYYQPLCWWLRGQLRLCQDYLADAAAARLASPEIYAEFLATRAAGAPLAWGLGIAGSKSDLYRRVAMLVQNPLKMESRCSTRWTIAAGCAAVALTAFAATFGRHPTAVADDGAVASDAAVERLGGARRQPPQWLAPIAQSVDELTNAATGQKDSPAEQNDLSNPQSARQQQTPAQKRMLERLATRVTRFGSGTIRFEKHVVPLDKSRAATTKNLGFMMVGTTWLLRADDARSTANSASKSNTGMVSMGGPPVPPASSRQFTLVEGGRCLEGILMDGVPSPEEAGLAPLRVERQTTLSVKHPEAVTRVLERNTPFGLGTIYYESGRRFIRDHAAAARFSEVEQLEVPAMNGIEFAKLRTQVIEWDVAGNDADEAFPDQNSFLARGGLLRVYVAEELDDLVARIEGIDRFGTVQYSATFFAEQPERRGALFHMRARFVSGDFRIDYVAKELAPPLSLKIHNIQFQLGIPVGVKVVDERLKKADFLPKSVVPGAFFEPNTDEYPFHTFTTAAAYPDGFPKKLLEEIDRDVLPWDPARDLRFNDSKTGGRGRAGTGSKSGENGSSSTAAGPGRGNKQPASAGPAESAKAPGTTSGKSANAAAGSSASPTTVGSTTSGGTAATTEHTSPTAADSGKAAKRLPIKAARYGGKDISEWHEMLVDDLDPVTRIQALEAMGTFGANGYAEETAQVIAGILLTGKEQSNNDHEVFRGACKALSRLGAAGVPVLQTQLEGNDPDCRVSAVKALVTLSRSTDTTLPVLLKVTQDSDDEIVRLAYPALVEHFLKSPEAFNAVRTALKSDDPRIRGAIVSSFANSTSPVDKALELLRLVLKDSIESIRANAAVQFASRAPGTAENIVLLKKSLLDSHVFVCSQFVSHLQTAMNRKARPAPELVIPVLIAILESPALRSADYPRIPEDCVDVLGNLAQAKIAETAIPVLIELVDRGSLNNTSDSNALDESVMAIDALGKFGRAAKLALPALKRRLDECDDEDKWPAYEFRILHAGGMKSVREYQHLIQSTIRKIEGE
jgi:beta-lactamase regulating signal transducer with metallopeptidase domain/HEAT repeat protein